MKLLKEINDVANQFDITIVDSAPLNPYRIDYGKGKGSFTYDGLQFNGTIDGTFGTVGFTVECSFNLYAEYSNNSFYYEYGSDRGVHDPGSGWDVNVDGEPTIDSISFTDDDGNPVQNNIVNRAIPQLKQEIVGWLEDNNDNIVQVFQKFLENKRD